MPTRGSTQGRALAPPLKFARFHSTAQHIPHEHLSLTLTSVDGQGHADLKHAILEMHPSIVGALSPPASHGWGSWMNGKKYRTACKRGA
eukprot:scaffold174658_cov19-Tisochrysis_lutea.AAC.1